MRRVLLYCHNVEGLGHIARTLRIAEEVCRAGDVHVNILTGCRFLNQFRARVAHGSALDFYELPWLAMRPDGRLAGENGRSADSVLEDRKRQICAFARAWQPTIFVADHNPAGLCGELWPTLTTADRERWPTTFVWGARDIWESPDLPGRLLRRVRRLRLDECLQHYDAVMAYSDPRWINTLASYESLVALPGIRRSVGFVTPVVSVRTVANYRPKVVLAMGGGAFGEHVTAAVWEDMRDLVRRGLIDLRIAVGPHAAHLGEPSWVDWRNEGVEIVTDTPIEGVIRDADVSISTAGYGTAYTVVQAVCGNLLVPVPGDAQEQYFRAMKLQTLQGIAVVDLQKQRKVGDIRRVVDTFLSQAIDRTVPFSCDGAASAATFLQSMPA